MTTNVFEFKISVNDYPEGNRIVDSIFEQFDNVVSVSYNGQEYTAEAGFSVSGRVFNVGNILAPFINGNIVKITFPHCITITK